MNTDELYRKIITSIIGNSIAETITIPICTTKTVYQTTNLQSPLLTAKHIYHSRGIYGFYAGTPPAVINQIIACSSKYTFYHIFKAHRITPDNDLFNNSINGILGGIAGTLLSHPFDVVKNYYQRGEPFNITRPTILYTGITQNIAKNILLYAMLYPFYDKYKSMGLSPFQASITTSLSITGILHPIDFLKVRKIAGEPLFIGWDPRLYYRGFPLNLARVVPHFAIAMTVIEWLCARI